MKRWVFSLLFLATSLLLIECLLFKQLQAQEECTVGVVSGRATVDGRPLLWKNRDTRNRDNAIYYFENGRFPYIAVVNAGDTAEVWMGVNAAGLAIMNAESRDLEGDQYDGEGFFMRRALQECATVADFEALLQATNKTGRSTTSHFGVIDATGAAALFETGNHTYTKFDANDTSVAPFGFVIRANFAFTGRGKGYGHKRYRRAVELFEKAVREGQLSYRYILQIVSRDLKVEGAPKTLLPEGCLLTQDSINRYKTASVAVFHGVRPGEDPRLTTMWVILGEPICGVAVPLWPIGDPPELLMAQPSAGPSPGDTRRASPKAPLNLLIQKIESLAYPDTSHRSWLRLSFLNRGPEGGLLKTTLPLEQEIFQQTQTQLTKWRKTFPHPSQIQTFETTVAHKVFTTLEALWRELQ